MHTLYHNHTQVWKKRYFMLGEGKLQYKDSVDFEARVKGECPLMGSVVSLIKEGEAGGKKNCFRLMSGMMYLTLQCANEKQMMEWASVMYHAISIANGGAYILQYERDRVAAQTEEDRVLQDEQDQRKVDALASPTGRSDLRSYLTLTLIPNLLSILTYFFFSFPFSIRYAYGCTRITSRVKGSTRSIRPRHCHRQIH